MKILDESKALTEMRVSDIIIRLQVISEEVEHTIFATDGSEKIALWNVNGKIQDSIRELQKILRRLTFQEG